MRTNYSIKNFRVFDENGVNFEINPITILTGCNSSGKSSMVKSIFLLKSFLDQVRNAIENDESVDFEKYKIDFSTYPNNLLGRFDRIVHENSLSNKVTFEYTIYSLMLSKDIKVSLTFTLNENDKLNNAYLDSISMGIEDDVFFTAQKNGDTRCNLNIIKNDCLDFTTIDFAIQNYCGIKSEYEFEGGISNEECEIECKKIIDFLKTVNKKQLKDTIIHTYLYGKNSIFHRINKTPSIIEWTKNNESFFYIPLIEELDVISQKDIKQFIDSLIDEKNSSLKDASSKVINHLLDSDAESFSDYFKKMENDYFENILIRNNILNMGSRFGLFKANNLKIYQNYIISDPRNHTTVPLDIDDMPPMNSDLTKEDEYNNWLSKPVDFPMIYEILMYLNSLYDKKRASRKESMSLINHDDYYSYQEDYTNPTGYYEHFLYRVVGTFLSDLVYESINPEWLVNMSYVSSSRVTVKRLYTLDAEDDFARLLKRYFNYRKDFLDRKDKYGSRDIDNQYVPDTFMNKWISKFGIGNKVSLDFDGEGLGVQLRIHKSENDKGRLLADHGYGITQLVSILLQIETEILSGRKRKIHNFWGLEQLYKPNSNDFSNYETDTIAIEEPEIHLHPNFQSLLANLITEAYLKYNIHFIIETHSEYLIRQLQLLVGGKDEKMEISNKDISILYVYSPDDALEAGEPLVKQIGLCKDGYLDDTFGPGFFNEATRLSRLLM